MFDMESRHIIEALRSGVPSRTVGQYFSQARPRILSEISERLEKTGDSSYSGGMVISGKYGEGKTHMLSTVFNLAQERNMVVSQVSLSKETPMDKLPVLYRKLMANTYLPGRHQPGFMQELEKITAGSPAGTDMILYSGKLLETDKLYYLLKSYFRTDEPEERFMLQADLEGDFISNGELKKLYRRLFSETAKYNIPFSKTKHTMDYFNFMSHLFKAMGYGGWVILVDETELMGRLSKKARLNAYRNMAEFLLPKDGLQSTFTMFALSASYNEDVIEARHELENLHELFPDDEEPMLTVIEMLSDARQLNPLTAEEIKTVFEKIIDFHGRAFNWQPQCTPETLIELSRSGGYLLRTKIRTAIEYLDELYQYGDGAISWISGLQTESFEEEPVSLSGLEAD